MTESVVLERYCNEHWTDAGPRWQFDWYSEAHRFLYGRVAEDERVVFVAGDNPLKVIADGPRGYRRLLLYRTRG